MKWLASCRATRSISTSSAGFSATGLLQHGSSIGTQVALGEILLEAVMRDRTIEAQAVIGSPDGTKRIAVLLGVCLHGVQGRADLRHAQRWWAAGAPRVRDTGLRQPVPHRAWRQVRLSYAFKGRGHCRPPWTRLATFSKVSWLILPCIFKSRARINAPLPAPAPPHHWGCWSVGRCSPPWARPCWADRTASAPLAACALPVHGHPPRSVAHSHSGRLC